MAPNYIHAHYILAGIKLEEAVRKAEGSTLQDELITGVITVYAELLKKQSSYFEKILASARKQFEKATNNFHSIPLQYVFF